MDKDQNLDLCLVPGVQFLGGANNSVLVKGAGGDEDEEKEDEEIGGGWHGGEYERETYLSLDLQSLVPSKICTSGGGGVVEIRGNTKLPCLSEWCACHKLMLSWLRLLKILQSLKILLQYIKLMQQKFCSLTSKSNDHPQRQI